MDIVTQKMSTFNQRRKTLMELRAKRQEMVAQYQQIQVDLPMLDQQIEEARAQMVTAKTELRAALADFS
jgi:uncharacterized membrane protein